MEARKHLLAARSAFLFSAFLPLEALNQRSVLSIRNVEKAMLVYNRRLFSIVMKIFATLLKCPAFESVFHGQKSVKKFNEIKVGKGFKIYTFLVKIG